jgi:hypothetical protein
MSENSFNQLKLMELQLREIWTEYIRSLELHEGEDRSKMLKDHYFRLYRKYRHDKDWKQIVNTDHEPNGPVEKGSDAKWVFSQRAPTASDKMAV